jgi:serine/threonine protein kinase
MSDEHNKNGETREMPLDELMLSEFGAGALPPSEKEEAEFAVGPKQLILGDYVLLRRIGAGANGRVFKARHRQMERLVALKMMAPATMRNPLCSDRPA